MEVILKKRFALMKRFASNSGLTLVEVIIAMAMLTIMLTGFATMYAFTAVTAYHAGLDAGDSAAARTTADRLIADDFGIVDPGTTEVNQLNRIKLMMAVAKRNKTVVY